MILDLDGAMPDGEWKFASMQPSKKGVDGSFQKNYLPVSALQMSCPLEFLINWKIGRLKRRNGKCLSVTI